MIRLICGPMFARKSEKEREIVESYTYRRKHVHILRPEFDTRPDVSTHGGAVLRESEYITISTVPKYSVIQPKVHPETALIVYPEAQFFNGHIVNFVKAQDAEGYDVLITCLDRDSQGQPFGSIKELLFLADEIEKRTAVCVCCSKNATRTQRIVPKEAQILVGASESYEPRCVECFRP